MSVAKSEIGTTLMAGGRVVAFRQMVTVIGAAVSCFLFGEQDDVCGFMNCSEMQAEVKTWTNSRNWIWR